MLDHAGTLPSVHSTTGRSIRLTLWQQFAMVAGAILAVLLAIQWNIAVINGLRAEITDAEIVQRGARDLGEDLLDAETGQRGYLLTGDLHFLDPYQEGVQRVAGAVQRLRVAVVEPQARADVDALVPLVDTKLAGLAHTLDLTRAGQHDAAVRLVVEGGGRRMMDQIRAIRSHLLGLESGRTAALRASITRAQATLQLTVALGGIAMLLVAFLAARRSAARLGAPLRSLLDQIDGLGASHPGTCKRMPAEDEIAQLELSVDALAERLSDALAARDRANQELACSNAALTASREHFRQLYQHTPAMLHSIDRHGRIIEVSDTWLQSLGYTREEVTGRASVDLLSPESRAYALQHVIPEFFRTGRIDQVEYQIIRKDGAVLDVLISAILEREDACHEERSVAIMTDITARKQAERALVASERRYRALVEDQSEMVSLSDPEGRLTFVNHAYARQFGCVPDDLLGTSLFDHIPAAERAVVAAHLAQVFQSRGVASGENHLKAADGSGERWVAWINRALLDEAGKAIGMHSVGRDITEEKTLLSQLSAKAAEIEDLYDHAPCGYHSLGSHGHYIKINATELGWLGCSRAEVIGKKGPGHFLDQQGALAFSRAFAECAATGGTRHMTGRLVGLHRVERDVSIRISVVLDEYGSFLMTRSVVFDISVQKDAERAVQRLNSEQRTILESELFGIARLRQRHFLWANAGLARLLGYSAEELAGTSIRDCYPDERTYQALGDAAYPIVEAGGTYRGESTMRRKDGSVIWVELTGIMLDAAAGESLWLFIDTTARKRAELALQSSQSLLEKTGAAAGVGGWEYDLGTGALHWTSETFRLHGLPVGIAPSVQQAIDFYAPESRGVIQTAVETAIAGGPAYDLELKVIRADGAPIWVRTVGVLECQDGKPRRLVGAFQDVTAKVDQIARIEHLYELAEEQRTQLAAYHEHALAEAEIASFLLSRLSRLESLNAAGVQYCWQPAESFSGDIIAVTRSSAGDTYGMLADATGHGLAAAINLIPLTTAFYAMAVKGFNLLTIAEELNRVAKEFSLPDRFVAVTLARVCHREGSLEVVNAGNPAALLLDDGRQVLREFRSGSVPLGILPKPQFRPRLEAVELSGGECLLVFSDGLIEAMCDAGAAFGRSGIDRALAAASSTAEIAATLGDQLRNHADGLAYADDVSVLVLPADLASPDATDEVRGSPAPAPHDLVAGDIAGRQGQAEGHWSVDLHFSARELRSLEVVPLIVNLTRNFGLPMQVESAIFAIMSELFQNALEHGLLLLDSGLKRESHGFDRYLELRATRLAELSNGKIEVSIIHAPLRNDHGSVCFVVTDSGPGFDHCSHLATLAAAQDGDDLHQSYGRGLTILSRLCKSLSFNAAGNQATVELHY